GVLARKLPNQLPAFGVPFAGDRAGIDDAEIGNFPVAGVAVADPLQRFPDQFGLVLVDLATQGHRAERCHADRQLSGSMLDFIEPWHEAHKSSLPKAWI